MDGWLEEGHETPARSGRPGAMASWLRFGVLSLLVVAMGVGAMQATLGTNLHKRDERGLQASYNETWGTGDHPNLEMEETTTNVADPDDLREGSLAQKIDKSLQQEFQKDEKGLQEAKHNISQSVAKHEAVLETVARVTNKHAEEEEDEDEDEVDEEDEENTSETHEKTKRITSGDDEVARLVDSHDNEFVISNPNKESSIQLQLDLILLKDLTTLVVMAFMGGVLSSMLGQPPMVGYLVAGSLCGPGGFGIIQELVQVETIAQLGIMFLLFTLGLEFKFDKVKNVWPVALVGGSIQIVLFMIVAATVSMAMGYPYKYGAFIGALVSMSSTTVVTKCLEGRGEAGSGGLYGGHLSTHVQIILGTLILQDCSVGLLFAILPTLAGTGGAITGFSSAIYVALRLCLFLAISVLLSRFIMPSFLKFILIHTKAPMELFRLASVALCLAISWSSEQSGLSLEFGAFVGGVMLAASEPREHITMEQTDQISALFVSLFVTSIGLIMSPYFLWNHAFLLLFTLLGVIVTKTLLTALVVRAFKYNMQTSLLVGVALSNIGEFAFVLLSKGRGLGLVRRQVYFLFLGVTAFSLMFSPLMFKLFPIPQKPANDVEKANPDPWHRRRDSTGGIERTSSDESLSLENDVLHLFERKKPNVGEHTNPHVRRLPTT